MSDYVPRALQVPVRVGVLGLSGVMFLGLMKATLAGPGIGGKLGTTASSASFLGADIKEGHSPRR